MRRIGIITLLLALSLAGLTASPGTLSVVAQADTHTAVSPVVTNAVAAETPELSEDEIEAALLTEAAQTLPEPPPLVPDQPDPAAQDRDGDRVPNEQDNCPTFPNPPEDGVQLLVCGAAPPDRLEGLVFLKSRTFALPAGVDPALQRTQQRDRMHALLHVRKNANGVVLSPNHRQQLEGAGVQFLDYLPYASYYVSLPRARSQLEAIAALEMVVGISALRPPDKVAPHLRLRGPSTGRNDDGSMTVEVDFFTDVPTSDIEQFLTANAKAFVHQYDNTYWVTLASWQDLSRLAIQDIVDWIDELPDEDNDRTENARSFTGAEVVKDVYGYDGTGIVLSMTENDIVYPADHPALAGRLTIGNNQPDITNYHPGMVATIMAGSSATIPHLNGFLPAATLVSYGSRGNLTRRNWYGIPVEAREEHGALLNNNSWGPTKCAKRGEYNSRGKWFDKAVRESGIVVVYAAGNTRGPEGTFGPNGGDCESDIESLPHPTAKNDISVGNWCLTTHEQCTFNTLADDSSAGPTADGRLKPDLVAPGDGVQAIGFDEESGQTTPSGLNGTSAAAPVVSGIVGLVASVFLDQGENILEIPPERFKALLIHTAKDVGPPGPDVLHGFGLVQAAPAVRIAEEWNDWGHEDRLRDDGPMSVSVSFDITSEIYQYKATLVWTDEQGKDSSSKALKNDLDLTLISPSRQIFRPFDVVLEGTTEQQLEADAYDGAETCPGVDSTCQDHVNNVEMVIARMPDGSALEQGTWEARVTRYNLVSDEQPFSLVLSPPCPLVIDQDTTLSGPISCGAHALQPAAVEITADNVELDCDGNTIVGDQATLNNLDKAYIGIRVTNNNVTLRNCHISQFDMGIALGEKDIAASQAHVVDNTLYQLTDIGIRAWGDEHLIENNNISEMTNPIGVGISVEGNQTRVLSNTFARAMAGGGSGRQTTGIHIRRGSGNGEVERNHFSGGWLKAILLSSNQEGLPVSGFSVSNNVFEGVGTPILLSGLISDTTVADNSLLAYRATHTGILITADDGFRPANNQVVGNEIVGAESIDQIGIQITNALTTTVSDNLRIRGVGIGIHDFESMGSVIDGNSVTTSALGGQFFVTAIGIQSTGSLLGAEQNGFTRITSNTVIGALQGIEVTKNMAPIVTGNRILIGGAVQAGQSDGIYLEDSDLAQVMDNTISQQNIGIRVHSASSATIAGNLIISPMHIGIAVRDDLDAEVADNEIDNNLGIGIRYSTGADARILDNEIMSSGVNAVGIQAGISNSSCVPVVSNLLIENNTLTGGGLDYEIFCDASDTIILP